MPLYPDLVAARLQAPEGQRSLCHACPLNGQRKVGHDGPLDAEHIAIFEAPGADEEDYLATKGVRYGRPLVGKTGYFMKLRHLAPLGLVTLVPGRNPKYPRIGALKVHLMNVIMCRPPKNKIDSVEGKKAVACCSNSALHIINRALAANPNISLHPAGGTALSMLRGVKTPIEPFRGRLLTREAGAPYPYVPEDVIYKKVLRGVKPKEEWWPDFEIWLKSLIRLFKKSSRRAERISGKALETSFLNENPWLTDWTKLWKKQRTAMRKREKEISNG